MTMRCGTVQVHQTCHQPHQTDPPRNRPEYAIPRGHLAPPLRFFYPPPPPMAVADWKTIPNLSPGHQGIKGANDRP